MEIPGADYPQRERLSDLLFAFPEGCEETRTTPISRQEYAYTRREWMQNTVRNCGRVGLVLDDRIFDVAFMTDEQLAKQLKPKNVNTWFDCGAELTAQLQRYVGPK